MSRPTASHLFHEGLHIALVGNPEVLSCPGEFLLDVGYGREFCSDQARPQNSVRLWPASADPRNVLRHLFRQRVLETADLERLGSMLRLLLASRAPAFLGQGDG